MYRIIIDKEDQITMVLRWIEKFLQLHSECQSQIHLSSIIYLT